MNVLIIDDNNSYCNSIKRLLEKHGHKTVDTWDDDIVEVLLKEFNPDIILIDHDLSNNYTGIDILNRLKDVGLFKQFKFYANSNDQDKNKKLKKAGCKAIMEKDTDKILNLVGEK